MYKHLPSPCFVQGLNKNSKFNCKEIAVPECCYPQARHEPRITAAHNSKTIEQSCSTHTKANAHHHCKRKHKRSYHNLKGPVIAQKLSPSSAYSEIVRPTSEQLVLSTHHNHRYKMLHPTGHHQVGARSGSLQESTCRRKLSSASKRNSRYKFLNQADGSSDDSDTSVATSKFGDYLSNLSACPSLENCASPRITRKTRRPITLKGGDKSPTEKCQDFIHDNFIFATNHGTSFDSQLHFEKNHAKKEMTGGSSSSTEDITASELEKMEYVYRDDSLDNSQSENTAGDNPYLSDQTKSTNFKLKFRCSQIENLMSIVSNLVLSR